MKKLWIGMAATLAILVSIFIAGCDWTDEQVKLMSQNSGLAAAVTWIAYDNPDAGAIKSVCGVINVISDQASNVQTGMTYTAIIFPEVQKLVNGDTIPSQYKPITLAGSLAVLNGIDLLLTMNPSWKEKEGRTLMAAQAFCLGAKQGLGLSDKDPIIVRARSVAADRSKILK